MAEMPMFKLLAGDKLDNGCIVITAKPVENHFIVFALNPETGEYATWAATNHSNAYWGHYFFNFENALSDYQGRKW